MKKITFLLLSLTFILTACEGDPGPPGPPGSSGQNGVNFVGQSFEVNLDFTSSNNYAETVEIPLDIDLYESDMVLVYRLVDVVDGYDVWKSLPETVYVNDTEEFQYNFEHNFDFVTIFIESHPTFDYNLVLDDERINQIFRVVVLPVDLINSNDIDINNYGEVMNYVE
ncbi:MAG: dihydrolipoamide dehydrogenase [Flavobacteriaceae bacterium]|uniref:dihydrolipoamide dehydrogenase n=1 Tax=Winogradskyella sp. SYSU M77433 TaxID=3042722 RepID=UPI000C458AB6|nr:dihydrolipoamide dehydrogenase [Winogradskyella sp. SYSU M77433]MAX70227.1 dihydrolipoamide dehydrogenase [Flavobacteriaceae bacterium]MDH7912423.1 dihydrolipoamide dehydrogenase [Winogradskyella sp. SYSU M77433]